MSQSFTRHQEQRDFHRMAINAKATIIYADDAQMHRVAAVCRDLSATGMSLEVDQPLTSGQAIEVIIEGLNVKPLDAKAEVIRVTEADNGRLLLGCKITSLS